MPVTDSREDIGKRSVIRDLKIVMCITCNVKLNQGNEKVSALLDSSSEANSISWAYVAQLPFKIMNISKSLTTINKQQISTQGIVIVGFEITNSRDRTCYFKETFIIVDIPQPVVLGMSFLKLWNLDVSWEARTVYWRQWDIKTPPMTTNRVDSINLEDFIHQVFEESTPAFISHMIMIDGTPPEVHPS